jgi:hypothetical protein
MWNTAIYTQKFCSQVSVAIAFGTSEADRFAKMSYNVFKRKIA